MLANTLKMSNVHFASDDPKIKLQNSVVNEETIATSSTHSRLMINDGGKRVVVSIHLGDLNSVEDLIDQNYTDQILIGSISISTRTNWDALDAMVKRLFADYLVRLDEQTSEAGGLGLGLDSIHVYYVGDMLRKSESCADDKLPDLLPYGYLVADHTNIIIKLKGRPEKKNFHLY